MQDHHKKALEEAEEMLKNVDPEEFLNEFIQLQKNAVGPTVDEFIESFNLEVK